jgi:hypothetical protein
MPGAGDSGAFFAFLLNPRLGLRLFGRSQPGLQLHPRGRVLSQAELPRHRKITGVERQLRVCSLRSRSAPLRIVRSQVEKVAE